MPHVEIAIVVPAPRLVTQEDVARAAGVNRATVSLAVRNHPSIAAATRERIQKIAAKLGYRLDPMLSALAMYRNSRRPAQYRGTLAWLARTTERFHWRENAHFAVYLAAASARAGFHGYRLDVIDLEERTILLERAASIIHSRGIRGVLLCPQPYSDTDLAKIPWDNLAGVALGYSITKPALHSVAPAQFRAAFATYREMQARGYRRIGFAFNREHDERTNHNYLGGYLAARELDSEAPRIPTLLLPSRSGNAPLVKWVRQHQLDGVIGTDPVLGGLRSAGYDLPEHLGFANPLLASPVGDVAGVWESNEAIADAAVDTLVAMLHRGEFGIPARPQRALIEGAWIEGASLRPRSDRPTA